MRTVVCVLRTGGIYTAEWVQKLAHGVQQNISGPYRFVCMSDILVEGVETIGFRHYWPGWWSKLEVFEPGLFYGPTLYLDLDTLIVGPIDDMFPKARFYMCQDFLRPNVHNSSVMAWVGPCSVTDRVYDAIRTKGVDWCIQTYDKQRPGGRIGDQAFIEDHATEIRTFHPSQIVSFKKTKGKVEQHTSIVAFHGRPKPPQAQGWAKEMWETL